MNINWDAESRLTWNEASLVPYESSWMIFRKIIALNHVSINELKALIEIDPKLSSSYDVVNFSRSGWINFERLSRLLNISESDLVKSFLDKIVPIGDIRLPVRYCPECWQYKYHCSLFDLPILQSCPWHRCELTSVCKRCISRASLNALCNSSAPSFCPRCRIKFPDLDEVISPRQMPIELSAKIGECCDAFVTWIKSLNKILGESSTLLHEFFGSDELVTSDKKRWLLGLAINAAGPPPDGWEFFCGSIAVNLTTFEGNFDEILMDSTSLSSQYSLQSDIGRYYKSVRRYISNTYLHNHQDCVKELLHLDDYEAHALDGVFVCPVALSFLSWRMSIEGVTLTQLKSNKDTNSSLHFMKPYSTFKLSDRDVLRWNFFSFFCIWHHINDHCGRNKLRIDRADMRREGYVLWKCDYHDMRHNIDSNEIVQQSRLIHVLFPAPDRLVRDAAYTCDRRRQEGETMLDYRMLNNYTIFGSWTDATYRFRNRRFSVTNTKFHRSSNSYDHLYV